MNDKLTARELSNFFGQLGMLIHSGISVTEGLTILKEESQTDTDREILTDLLASIEETGSLTKSMDASDRFPHSSVSYVRTGEETGCLDEILSSLSTHYEQEQEISDQIRNAVTYPLLMLGMMAVIIVVLLVKVLPVFQQVFQQMGMEMNSISLGLLHAGKILSNYSVLFLILAALLIAVVLFLSLSSKGHRILKKAAYHFPGFRDIPLASDYSRLTQGLALGLKSGLSPDMSLELSSDLVSHPVLSDCLKATSDLLNQGVPFYQALTESKLFSGMEGRLISVGFQSGSADEALSRLSVKYREKAVDLISEAIAIVEPTIVIILSLLVGLVLLSVMMPLLGILSDIAL